MPPSRAFPLDDADAAVVRQALMREPTPIEAALIFGMWSEHCSYRSTRHLLADLPQTGPHLIAGPGAHAGVVEVGEGWAVAFKIESHNHPSAVEPYQGAATGVGGILRDIIAAGARPCALLDSLCFGSPADADVRVLIEGVFNGIAGYGNAIGVPNVGGRTTFDSRYSKSPLVNVLAAGLLRHDALRDARACGSGNALILVGATTGRDGLHGATFASAPLADSSSSADGPRSHVQVGDPFSGKRLLEACLSFDRTRGLLAGQDLGACGLFCAASEMAFAGGVGVALDLDAVPLREPNLDAIAILLSETQERFLFVVDAQLEKSALDHFRGHGLMAVICGRVTDDGRFVARHRGVTCVDLPVPLIKGAPPSLWPRAPLPPPLELPAFAQPADLGDALLRLLALPDIADLSPRYDKFDHTVGNATVRGPGEAACAVLRLPDSRRGFALTVSGDGAACAVDPYLGAQAAVAQALRDLGCAGARMVAVTDGLNAASPRDPVAYQGLCEVIRGLADALRKLDVPVSGGNVSLYNQSAAGAIPPTPMVGALGIIEDVGEVPRAALEPQQTLWFTGTILDTPNFSRYGQLRSGVAAGPLHVDLAAEQRLAQLLVKERRRLRAAKGSGRGGLLCALAKLCLRGGCGVEVRLPATTRDRLDWLLFGEYAAQALVTTAAADDEAFSQAARDADVPCLRAGITGGERLRVCCGEKLVIDLPLSALAESWKAPHQRKNVREKNSREVRRCAE